MAEPKVDFIVPNTADIPDPSLFKGLTSSNQTSTQDVAENLLPTLAQCLVHLELLGCFASLRQKVESNADLDWALELGAEQLDSRLRSASDGVDEKERAKERWNRFIGIAVYRFEVWWEKIGNEPKADSENVLDMERKIPPLEILMVLHTFMLNPRSYYDYCLAKGMSEIWMSTSFPWSKIHKLINNYDFSYTLPSTAEKAYTELTGFSANLYEELRQAERSILRRSTPCPKCGHVQDVPCFYPSDGEFGTKLQPLPENCESMECDFIHDYNSQLTMYTKTLKSLYAAANPSSPELTSHVLDLPAAILRQGRFIHDIHSHNLLIRSPAVRSTISLSIRQFHEFFTLISLFPGTTFVPTSHVDLAWHTLLLDPATYKSYTEKMTRTKILCNKDLSNSFIMRWRVILGVGSGKGKLNTARFVDHNDRIVIDGLRKGRDVTKWAHGKIFGRGKWKVCLCWECMWQGQGHEDVPEKWKEVERARRKELQEKEEKQAGRRQRFVRVKQEDGWKWVNVREL